MNPSDLQTDSWPQAAVFIVLIFCVVAMPTLVTMHGNRQLKKVKDTLTINGGKSNPPTVLDRLHVITSSVDELKEAQEHQNEAQEETRKTVLSLDQRVARIEQEQAHAAQPKRFGLF